MEAAYKKFKKESEDAKAEAVRCRDAERKANIDMKDASERMQASLNETRLSKQAAEACLHDAQAAIAGAMAETDVACSEAVAARVAEQSAAVQLDAANKEIAMLLKTMKGEVMIHENHLEMNNAYATNDRSGQSAAGHLQSYDSHASGYSSGYGGDPNRYESHSLRLFLALNSLLDFRL